MAFLDQIKQRRSIYSIGKNVELDQAEIEKIIKDAVKHSPSSFNSQTSRVVILFGQSHDTFWHIVRETLRDLVSADAFESTNSKINAFAAGYGTALFYEDQNVVKSMQEQFALYADNFPVWSEHSSAIAQFATWTALAEKILGLHYSTIIQLLMRKSHKLSRFHLTGNFVLNWYLGQLKHLQVKKPLWMMQNVLRPLHK